MGRMEGKLLRAVGSDDGDRGQALQGTGPGVGMRRGRQARRARRGRPGRVTSSCSFACGAEGKTAPFVSRAILSSRARAVATLEKSDFVTGRQKTQGPSLQTCFLGFHDLLWRNRGQSL